MNDGTSFSLFQCLVCSSTVMICYFPRKVLCGIIIQKLRITWSQTKTNPRLSFTTIAISTLNKRSNLSQSNKITRIETRQQNTVLKQSHPLHSISSKITRVETRQQANTQSTNKVISYTVIKTEERRSLIDPNYIKDTTFCFPASKEDSFQGKGMKLR